MSTSSHARVFIGLRPPEELAERIAKKVSVITDDTQGLRTYADTDLHVTLCFVGQLEREAVGLLGRVLTEELRGVWAPELRFGDLQAFPDRDDPRVYWLGVEESGGRTRLAALAARAQGAAQAVGWRAGKRERGRGFVPHLTVARRRAEGEQAHAALWTVGFSQPWFPVEVTLFESRPDQPEERYLPLVSVPLVVGPG